MARDALNRDLIALRTDVADLGQRIDAALADAMNALTTGNIQEAVQVMAGDAEVDRLRTKLETLCLEIIAAQQPLATDLRQVMATLDVAANLERMGDHCEGLAHLTELLAAFPPAPPSDQSIEMARITRQMVSDALRSFAEQDAELAEQVIARDTLVDLLHSNATNVLLSDIRQQPALAMRATYHLWVIHNLERIADRATNIAERSVFVVTGNLQPHVRIVATA